MSLVTRVKLGSATPIEQALQTARVGTPPTHKFWATQANKYPMYGNDVEGDCTCAAIGHMIEVWCINNGSAYLPTRADIVRLYNSTPDAGGGGRDMSVVLRYFEAHGFGGNHKLFWTNIDPHNHGAIRDATYFLGGGCAVTVGLPNSIKTQRAWRVSGSNNVKGSYGWHTVDVVGYSDVGLVVCTWGQLVMMTWAFYDKYVGVAYAVLGWDWIGASGTSPLGHTWKQLADAFRIGV